MMFLSDDPPKRHGRHRNSVENDMIRRREKEFKYQEMWNGAKNYYNHFGKVNTQFDAWTSPRYYEDNNKMLGEIREKRNKEELLEKRREKLKRLLEEEQKSNEIEMIVTKSLSGRNKAPVQKPDDIPTEVLKDVNIELKQKEEEKRRREAELKLYHQWRINNPIVRQFESKYRFKDLKLSWLDQQVERRMQKEKEEEELKKLIKEQEKRLKREKEREEIKKREIGDEQERLKKCLEKQMEQLKEKQKISDNLRKREDIELKQKQELEELIEREKIENKRRIDREVALFNIKKHKQKLKQKAADIQENLTKDREFTARLKQLELEDLIRDERKRQEIKEGLDEFLNLVREQQDLEKRRQAQMDFLFDSEAKAVYEKQTEIWKREEMARKTLLNDVLKTIHKQVEENHEKNKQKQLEILQEREEIMKNIELYDKELQNLKIEEEIQKKQKKNMLDDDLKLKNARIKQQKCFKLKEIDEELERVKKEEERLQKEILAIQRRQGPYKPHGRSRILY